MSTPRTPSRAIPTTVLVLCASLLGAGCATTRPPAAEAIGAAEYALRKAKEDGADGAAAARIAEAEDKLARAKAARADGDDAAAVRLAHEVSLEAQVAEAKAENVRIHQGHDEIEKGNEALESELQRGLQRSTP